MRPLLSATGVSKRFGGVQALDAVDLSISPGHIHGLIGPNGAGKTSLFNVLTGLYHADTGTVQIDGRVTSGVPPHEIVAAGLSRTFQNIRLFASLSVLDNVLVGAHQSGRSGVLGALLGSRAARAEQDALRERCAALLDRVGVGAHALRTAS